MCMCICMCVCVCVCMFVCVCVCVYVCVYVWVWVYVFAHTRVHLCVAFAGSLKHMIHDAVIIVYASSMEGRTVALGQQAAYMVSITKLTSPLENHLTSCCSYAHLMLIMSRIPARALSCDSTCTALI